MPEYCERKTQHVAQSIDDNSRCLEQQRKEAEIANLREKIERLKIRYREPDCSEQIRESIMDIIANLEGEIGNLTAIAANKAA